MFRKSALHLRDLIESYLPDDAEVFAAWAFGDDFATIPLHTFWERWNERHSDKLTLAGSGSPQDDVPRLIELWKNKEK